jgi:hypothetical protein
VIPRSVMLGSNEFLGCEVILAVGDDALLAFDIVGGDLYVDVTLRVPPATEEVVVRRNEVEIGDAVILVDAGRITLSVRGRVLIVAQLIAADAVRVEALDLLGLGLAVTSDPSSLRLGSAVLAGNSFVGARVGVQLGASSAARSGSPLTTGTPG